MPTSPRPCHSHASDRVTGVGNRPSEKGNGLPRRFAPRNDKVRRGGRLCPPEQREALSFRASDRVTGVGIRPSEKGNGLPRCFAPRNDKVRRGGRLWPPVSLAWESVSPALTKTGFVSSIKRKLFSFLRKCLV